MQQIPLKPRKADVSSQIAALAVLGAVMLASPALCAPLSLLIPVLACPLIGRKQEFLSWMTAAVPVISSLAAGYDWAYSLSLLLMGGLALSITKWIPMKKRVGAAGMLWYLSAVTLALVVIAALASRALGGSLTAMLPQTVVSMVEKSEDPFTLLVRMASYGLLALPEGFENGALYRTFTHGAMVQQMLWSLRRTIELMAQQLLPSLFVQGCLLSGLFTALRVERAHGVVLVVEMKTASEKQTRVAVPPGFRLLTLPRGLRWTLWMMAIAALVLVTESASFAQVLGRVCHAAFESVYTLAGAAVMVHVFARRHPDRLTLIGVLAGVIYVMAPSALFIIGIMDQAFHFRMPRSHDRADS